MASLVALLNTRFGDPITALDMNDQALVYGTALGKISFYSFESKTLTDLIESSEEPVRGIRIIGDLTIYAAIGDLYIIIFRAPLRENFSTDLVYY